MWTITTGVKFKGEGLSIEVTTERNDLRSDDVINAIVEARNATKDDADKELDLSIAVRKVAVSVARYLRMKPFAYKMVKVKIGGPSVYAEHTVLWDEMSDRPMAR